MANFHFSPRPNRAHEVDWREWGQEAFDEAREQDKLLLLDIGAVWCHWCHVMDETTYSDPQVIRLLNERFIPVRVDNDERPDVNRRYNMGGWPTTAILTPAGEALTGGTYIPANEMTRMLVQLSQAYVQAKDAILTKAREVDARRDAMLASRKATRGTLSDEIVTNVLKAVKEGFDTLYGGFGDAPKFPAWEALELALAHSYDTGDENYRALVTITLKRVLMGEMYDLVAGGFFRYATARDWTAPHYEKMLEDNARWLVLLAHAYQVTERAEYLEVIRSLVNYVQTVLREDKRDGFFGSQDADEEYYALDEAERASRPAPYVDRTLYTDWNMQMVSAYFQAARLLKDASLQKYAINVLATLLEKMFSQDEGMRHSLKPGSDTPELGGLLADQTYTARALIDAYQATGRNTYLFRAKALMDFVIEKFEDKDHGGFYSEIPDRARPGLLRLPDKQMNENAVAAEVLLQLADTCGEKYREAAQRALEAFVGDYQQQSFLAADYARAVKALLHEPTVVRVVGKHGDEQTQALVDAARDLYAPDKRIEWLDPTRDAERIKTLGFPAPADAAVAYVCAGQACLPGTSDPQKIREGVERLRAGAKAVKGE